MSRYDLIDFEWRVIERFFSKLFRRVATRYDKHAANFLAMVQLASMRLWLRAYESTAYQIPLPSDVVAGERAAFAVTVSCTPFFFDF